MSLHGPVEEVHLPLLLVVVGLSAGAVGYGGFSRPFTLALFACVAVAVAVATTDRSRRAALAHLPIEVIGTSLALAGLGAWALLRGSWGVDAWSGVPMAALCLGCTVILLMIATAPDDEREVMVVSLLVVGSGLAVVGGLASLLHRYPLAVADQGIWRAASTLGYTNALAGLLALLALVAAGRQCTGRSPGGAVLLALLLAGWVSTFSRGGAVAMAAGLVVLLVTVGPRSVLRAAWAPALGAVLMIGGLAPSLPETATPQVLPAVAGLLAGLSAAVAPLLPLRRAALVVAGVVVAGAAVAVTALFGGRVLAAAGAVAAGKVSLNSSYRIDQHGAAFGELSRHPLTGTGPGAADLTWTEPGGAVLVARYVHDEYVQVVTETGAIGGVLLVLAVAGMAVVVWRGRRDDPGPAWAGIAAGLTAFAVHSAFDFLWHIPVLPLTAVCLVAAAGRRAVQSRSASSASRVAATPAGSASLE